MDIKDNEINALFGGVFDNSEKINSVNDKAQERFAQLESVKSSLGDLPSHNNEKAKSMSDKDVVDTVVNGAESDVKETLELTLQEAPFVIKSATERANQLGTRLDIANGKLEYFGQYVDAIHTALDGAGIDIQKLLNGDYANQPKLDI